MRQARVLKKLHGLPPFEHHGVSTEPPGHVSRRQSLEHVAFLSDLRQRVRPYQKIAPENASLLLFESKQPAHRLVHPTNNTREQARTIVLVRGCYVVDRRPPKERGHSTSPLTFLRRAPGVLCSSRACFFYRGHEGTVDEQNDNFECFAQLGVGVSHRK